MRLYHGTNIGFDDIELAKCRPYKDFGRGIYLTSLESQAQEWARRVVERTENGKPTVLVFEYYDIMAKRLNMLVFSRPDSRWAHFVMNNRDRRWRDSADPLANHDAKYDIVEGPVANDDIATTFSLFTRGILDDEQLIRQLQYKNLNRQISFHSQRALRCLNQVTRYELD
jgi:hypothetical protein